jgi:hypothetical protein
MNRRAVELTEIKRDLARLPENKLAEVREFVRQLIPPGQRPRIESLRGIWKGLGWENIEDLEGEIRLLRKESENQILERFNRCNS